MADSATGHNPHPHAGWGPAGLAVLLSTGLVPLLVAWRSPSAEQVQKLQSDLEKTVTELESTKKTLQLQTDAWNAYIANASKWGRYVDGSLCELGVLPPFGCPQVQFLAKPLKKGGAHTIQPSLGGVKPLGEKE